VPHDLRHTGSWLTRAPRPQAQSLSMIMALSSPNWRIADYRACLRCY